MSDGGTIDATGPCRTAGRSTTVTADPDSVAWWLRTALGDLMGARAILIAADVPAREAAFLAHQAAEKALKAAILSIGTEPPWTHDLLALRLRAPAAVQSRTLHLDIASLSAAAVAARDPDLDDPPYERDEVARFVAIASEVIDVSRAHLETTGLALEGIEPA
jgi:HEPN domain-containing protein